MQKAAFLSARDSRRSPFLRSPRDQPHRPADTIASPLSQSSLCTSVSADPKRLALVLPGLRRAPHETSPQPPDALPADTNSTTMPVPSFHDLRETASSPH